MKRIIFILLIMLTMFSSVGCNQNKETKLLPPEKGEDVTLRPSQLIYQNDRGTSYSLGAVGSIFTFSDDTLEVKGGEEIKTYEISYDKVPLTIEDFKKQFQPGSEIPDISSYKNIVQYDLCKATDDLPGYRLYVLDGEYWMGTLYKNPIWRIIALNPKVDEIQQENVTVVLGYDMDDSEEIFGDLSDEEIKDITDQIIDRVSNDGGYTIDKKDSIIEEVFKENGIKDEDKINAAKSKITISK